MNFRKFTKKDWQWAYDHRCREHNRRYTEHPACLEAEYPGLETPSGIKEKILFFDIETTGLTADFSYMLCWTTKMNGQITSGTLNEKDFKQSDMFRIDKRIVEELVEELLKADRIVGHYSKRFDAPYVRARALIDNVPFLDYGSIFHTDLYDIAKRKLRISSKRLESIERVLFGKTEKTHLDGAIWISAGRGDKKALKYILKHNILDVEILERCYNKLARFARIINSSI